MAKNGNFRNKKWKKKQLPSKQTINLATVGVEKIRLSLAIPGILLIIGAAALFSKYGVYERFQAARREQMAKNALQKEVDTATARLSELQGVREQYAHYTYSGMDEEELSRADRIEAISLLERVVFPEGIVGQWSIEGNQIILPIEGATLQQINLLVQKLQMEDIVSYCSVTTAESSLNTRGDVLDTEEETESISEAENETAAGQENASESETATGQENVSERETAAGQVNAPERETAAGQENAPESETAAGQEDVSEHETASGQNTVSGSETAPGNETENNVQASNQDFLTPDTVVTAQVVVSLNSPVSSDEAETGGEVG